MTLKDTQILGLLQKIEAAAALLSEQVYPLLSQIDIEKRQLNPTPPEITTATENTAFDGIVVADLSAAFIELDALRLLLESDDNEVLVNLEKVTP